jgi:hypothetical protein
MHTSEPSASAPKNYVEQAKAFLNKGRLLRAVPLAVMAITSLHAATTFGPAGFTATSPCGSGGSFATTSNFTGSSINSGRGISLGGAASRTISSAVPTNDCLTMIWAGSGSGTFDASTMPIAWNFVVGGHLPPTLTVTGWNLVVRFNGSSFTAPESRASSRLTSSTPRVSSGTFTTFSCSSGCTGNIVGSGNANTPGAGVTLSSWEVQLVVNATWNSPGGSTLTVNVPPNTSIDLNAAAPGAGIPAVSNLMLALLAVALLAMGSAFVSRPAWGPPRL